MKATQSWSTNSCREASEAASSKKGALKDAYMTRCFCGRPRAYREGPNYEDSVMIEKFVSKKSMAAEAVTDM